ncbi:MAG: hypothetical protein AAF483_05160, partial [Planctomycetota bacterium]
EIGKTICCIELQRTEEALQQLNRLRNDYAVVLEAWIAALEGDGSRAQKCIKKFGESQSYLSTYLISWIFLKLGNESEVKSGARIALDLCDDLKYFRTWEVERLIALADASTGNFKAACESPERAIESGPASVAVTLQSELECFRRETLPPEFWDVSIGRRVPLIVATWG